MNVTCNNCGKKYVISDDKVAGKASVKIRCKQCQSLISVAVTGAAASAGSAPSVGAAHARPSRSHAVSAPPAPAASPWAEEQTRAMPAMDTSATWYAMIQGAQVGPLDLRALSAKVNGGEVTLRTYLWKPGMGDWKRASDVPEVSPIFAGVSVGATATGPTQPAPEARRTGTRAPAVQRDVATANEVPSPEVAAPRRTGAHSGVRGKVTPESTPAVEPAPQPRARPQVQAQPLNDLFGDLGGTGETPAPSQEHATSATGDQEQASSAPVDPFAQLSGGDDAQAPPIGEATRFFIAQAGVNKRNPPWKVALFVFAFIGVPVGLVYLLQSFHIVELPTVTRTNEDGTVTQEPFFSPGGMSGLKDLLTGDAKRKQAEAERLKKEKEALAAAAGAKVKPQGTDTPEPPPQPRPQDPSLAAFYQDEGKKTVGPKVRKSDQEANPGSSVNSAGLSAEAVAKVVADKSKAFQLCIDQALHRNPNLSVGNITVVLNVGASGAVKGAFVEPKKHEGSDWAQCMVSAARRIVFPSSDGETQVELPFKVGVALSP
ncbi:MAG: zinc-ribbon domain-containing protein [Myxococcales bacterium]|nr:zinc-ribbon domain-containing protein [Myxococcales bacterium]